MAKFLFGWEFGGGMGHAGPISEFAKRLIQRGHDVEAITKNAYTSTVAFGGFNVPCYALPKPVKPKKKLEPTVSMAEVLYNVGYHSSASLAVTIAAWHNLVKSIRPDVLIVNYAPSAILAARALSIPTLQFGHGFEIPPPVVPMPGFAVFSDIPRQRLEKSEKGVMGKVNRALGRLGLAAIDSLAEAFRADQNILVTFPELDHYQKRADGRYVGPLVSAPFPSEPPWPAGHHPSKRIFCYLKGAHAGTEKLLRVLGSCEANVLVYASGLSATKRQAFETQSLHFSDRPVDLKQACSASDFVVCHAGHGTVTAALMHGAGMLLLPEKSNLEQQITALNIQRLGIGFALSPASGEQRMTQALNDLFESNSQSQCEVLQGKYSDFDPESAWECLLTEAERLAKDHQPRL